MVDLGHLAKLSAELLLESATAVLDALDAFNQSTFVFDSIATLINENAAVHAVFDGYEYYDGVLTDVNGINVLIIANTDAPGTALYLSLIEEG